MIRHQAYLHRDPKIDKPGLKAYRHEYGDRTACPEIYYLPADDWGSAGRPTQLTIEVRVGHHPFHD